MYMHCQVSKLHKLFPIVDDVNFSGTQKGTVGSLIKMHQHTMYVAAMLNLLYYDSSQCVHYSEVPQYSLNISTEPS